MTVLARFVQALIAACRSMAKAAKRIAKPVLDKTGKVVDWVFDRTHDVIDVAEHAAAVPGAAVGAVLGGIAGNRGPDAADIAEAAMASAPRAAAPVAPAPVAQPKPRSLGELVRMHALSDGGIDYADLPPLPAHVAAWLADMSWDDRQGFARWSPAAIERHVRARSQDDLILGVPACFTPAQAETYHARKRQEIAEAFAILEREGELEAFYAKCQRNEGGVELDEPEPAGLRR